LSGLSPDLSGLRAAKLLGQKMAAKLLGQQMAAKTLGQQMAAKTSGQKMEANSLGQEKPVEIAGFWSLRHHHRHRLPGCLSALK
jgi:hypothetical protein